MTLFNKEFSNKDFEVDYSTNKVLISLNGCTENYFEEDYSKILDWLGFDEVILDIEGLIDDFILNGLSAIEIKNVYNDNKYNFSIILPKVFLSKKEAVYWFTNKLNDSNYIGKYKLDNIEFIDADKLISFKKK